MPTAYELQRDANIARNKALLSGLGIHKATAQLIAAAPVRPAAPKASKSRKRKTPPPSDSGDTDEEPAPKAPRRDESGLRRSGRNAGKTVDYKTEKSEAQVKTVVRKKDAQGREPGTHSKRVNSPKKFGSIRGVEVGEWWQTREECSNAAIHAPWVGGISGCKDGTWSIALSGGYEDDVDLGEGFTYTGAGGRDLKGTKNKPKNLRTAPQSSDQTFENNGNRSLLASSKSGKPVRVIRGFKLRSPYAPAEGYRYDGLYTVEKAWQEPGMNPGGFKVCKFVFKRVPGQPPLPVRELDAPAPAAEDAEVEVEEEEEIEGGDEEMAAESEPEGEDA